MDQKFIKEAMNELVTIRDVLRWATTRFNEAQLFFGHGTNNAWDEALAIVLPVLHLSYDSKPNLLSAKLTTSERRQIIELIVLRISQRMPVPYLMRQAWFSGLPFYVDQRVIIPRSPIAELIERQFAPWVDAENVHTILDLCTGSGCIAIACALQFPEAVVDAVDLSEGALAVAKINTKRYEVQNQVNLIQGDLFDLVFGKFYDIIVCNPPYVTTQEMACLPAEYHHEPQLALAAGDDGLSVVTRILKEAMHYLTAEGILVVEVGNSAAALIAAYPQIPFTWLEFSRSEDGVFLLTREQLDEWEGVLV
jgi:ribosomal protein L3 glutamine methyltransferase